MLLRANTSKMPIIKTIALEFIFSLVIILISLRSYIFGNGFFDYADQTWLPTIYFPHLVSFQPVFRGNIVEVLAYTRTIVTWPGTLLSYISQNPVMQEKIFISYTFLLFLAFSYVLAELIYRLANAHLNFNFNFIGKELFKLFVVVAIYSNIAIMNLNIDGGTWADGLIIVFMAIVVVYSLYSSNKLNVLAISSVLLSISILLDPDYYLAFVLVIFFSFLSNYRYSIIYRLALPLSAISISIPVLIFIIEGMLLTSSGTPGNPLEVRPINSAAADYGGVMNPVSSILLVGHYWSTYAISPPTILALIGKDILVPFYGNIVILPYSWVTYVWIAFLALYPVLAISSLLFSETRKISIPFAIMWLVGFILTIWWNIPLINTLFYKMATIPIVGAAIGTTLAEPGHYMNVEAISEVVLLAITLSNVLKNEKFAEPDMIRKWIKLVSGLGIILMTASFFTLYHVTKVSISIYVILSTVALVFLLYYVLTNGRVTSFLRKLGSIGRQKKKLRVAISIIIVIVVITVGWQAFDGSFYPERAWYGNSYHVLSDPGGFDPVNIPSYVVNVYNALTSDPSYNVIFYSPNLPNNAPGIYTGGNGLYYLISMNYSSAIVPFLRIENVKYVITYNDPPYVTNILNSSGMRVRYIGPSSYLYTNSETLGNLYQGNILLNYSGNDMNYLVAYQELGSMGITPVISKYGSTSLGFNEYNKTVNILSPQFIIINSSTVESVNSSKEFSINKTIPTWPVNWKMYIGNDWYSGTNSSESTNIYLYNGTFLWDDHKNVSVSVFYANSTDLPGGYVGVPIPNYENVSAIVSVRYQYKESENFSGRISGFIQYLYQNSPGSGFIAGEKWFPEENLNNSVWNNASFKMILPFYTKWFFSGIVINGTSNSGYVSIRNVNISLGLTPRVSGVSEFNTPVLINNTSLDLNGSGTYYFYLNGSGYINNDYFHNNSGEWLPINTQHLDFKGRFWVKAAIYINNYSLFHYLGNYTVFNAPYSSQYRLLENGRYFKPYYTLNGETFFFAPLEKGSKVIILNIIYDLYYIYLGIVVLLIMILIIPTLIKYRIKKS